MVINYLVNDGKWWLIIWLVVEPYPSEKYEFVSWDDDIPNIWKHQPANLWQFEMISSQRRIFSKSQRAATLLQIKWWIGRLRRE